jgi:hypothetical protein
MPKKITGIILDFPAAKDIHERAVASEIAVISNLRANDRLYFAAQEEIIFRQDATAALAFGNAEPSYLDWDDAALSHCDKIAAQIPEHRYLGQNRLPVFIAALAKARGLGVVSGIKIPSHFVSPKDCCKLLGVYCWTVSSFYSEYGNIKFV